MFSINLNNLDHIELTDKYKKDFKLELYQNKPPISSTNLKEIQKALKLQMVNLESNHKINSDRLKDSIKEPKYPPKLLLKAKNQESFNKWM